MQMKIIRKEYLGKDYAFIQADLEQTPDISYIQENKVDGLITVSENLNMKKIGIMRVCQNAN